MTVKRYSNVIGFDDAPFSRNHLGSVKIVGTVYAGLRFDGVLIDEVDKDGFDAARKVVRVISESKFAEHVQLIMFQGIAMAGFNVIDVFHIYDKLQLPVLIVSRKRPDRKTIKRALNTHIQEGDQKWAIIEKLGKMEPVNKIYVQRVGVTYEEASRIVETFSIHGHIPEPVRTAHLIAGALEGGQSRGNP